jgi:hypothetical protein
MKQQQVVPQQPLRQLTPLPDFSVSSQLFIIDMKSKFSGDLTGGTTGGGKFEQIHVQTLDLHWNLAAPDSLSGLLGKFNMLFIIRTLF